MSSGAMRDALAQKASSMERCIARAREELRASPDFATDLTRQDAALLNVQRACELAIDMANMVVSHEQWGLPDSARDAFNRLHQHGVIDLELARALGRMVGFRNIAVHAYEKLDMNIVVPVIERELDNLSRVAGLLVNRSTTH